MLFRTHYYIAKISETFKNVRCNAVHLTRSAVGNYRDGRYRYQRRFFCSCILCPFLNYFHSRKINLSSGICICMHACKEPYKRFLKFQIQLPSSLYLHCSLSRYIVYRSPPCHSQPLFHFLLGGVIWHAFRRPSDSMDYVPLPMIGPLSKLQSWSPTTQKQALHRWLNTLFPGVSLEFRCCRALVQPNFLLASIFRLKRHAAKPKQAESKQWIRRNDFVDFRDQVFGPLTSCARWILGYHLAFSFLFFSFLFFLFKSIFVFIPILVFLNFHDKLTTQQNPPSPPPIQWQKITPPSSSMTTSL